MDIDKIRESPAGLWLREKKHRLTYRHRYLRMEQALERYRTCRDKKEPEQIRREMALCKQYWGCYPLHYLRYNQYRTEAQLCEEELLDYIPEFYFYTLFLPHHDLRSYESLLSDKSAAACLFSSLDFPTPHTLAHIRSGNWYGPDFRPVTTASVAEQAARFGSDKLFLKPAYGMGGYGIQVFRADGSGQFRDSYGASIGDLAAGGVRSDGDYILQAGLTQHSALSEVYPNSVNTFRITTENRDGRVRAVCSVLRFGREGREVDNICQGGIILKVDGETGETGGFGCLETGERFAAHPDTGFSFCCFSIPDWPAVRDFALECAARLPFYTYLGWDIALTPAGPVVIETNLGFALDLFQVAHGGLRRAFRIDDPHFYWRNTGKRIECACP